MAWQYPADSVRVEPGEGWWALARRIAPNGITDTQTNDFARALAVSNGTTLAEILHPDRILVVDPATIPEPEPEPEPPTIAEWSEVDVGPGNRNDQRRILTPDDSVYPNLEGVSFWLNDEFNRTDETGPQEDSVYSFYPYVDLQEGDLLRAEWTDRAGHEHVSAHIAGAEKPEPEPPGPEPEPEPEPPGPVPPLDEFPSPDNTGYRGDLNDLDQRGGTIDADRAGEVIEYVRCSRIRVRANNVTIRHCVVDGGNGKWIDIQSGIKGTTVEDVTLHGPEPMLDLDSVVGVYVSGGTSDTLIQRCCITMCRIGVQGYGSDCLIRDNYIDHNWWKAKGHGTATSWRAGNNVTWEHNTLKRPNPGTSACLALYGDSPMDNMRIVNNLMGGGKDLHYAINGGNSKAHPPTNVAIVGNVFECSTQQVLIDRPGELVPLSRLSLGTETGENVWDDGTPI